MVEVVKWASASYKQFCILNFCTTEEQYEDCFSKGCAPVCDALARLISSAQTAVKTLRSLPPANRSFLCTLHVSLQNTSLACMATNWTGTVSLQQKRNFWVEHALSSSTCCTKVFTPPCSQWQNSFALKSFDVQWRGKKLISGCDSNLDCVGKLIWSETDTSL